MEAKGKVVAVRKGWGGMYPSMPMEEGGKPELEIELDGGGRMTLPVSQAEAKEYPFGSKCTVKLELAGEPPSDGADD